MAKRSKERKRQLKLAKRQLENVGKTLVLERLARAEEGHKKTGFNKITAKFVQGGAPGSGKSA
jgi:hypothetical protein